MAQKPVEVKDCIPGARSLAEAGDKHYARRREEVWAPVGCSLCNNEPCLADSLLACTSLKEVCTTLSLGPWAWVQLGSPGLVGPYSREGAEFLGPSKLWRMRQWHPS